MRAVILAAGDGGRLHPLTLNKPKVLLEIGGRPLIHYSLEALLAGGISEIGVVIGHQAEQVLGALQETYPHLTFIFNEHHEGENALSVYAARSFVSDEDFVVCMGDHPIGPDIIQELLSGYQDGCVLCVDSEARHASQVSDATRVVVGPGGYVLAIGKRLEVWDAVDTGVFQMNGDVFLAVEQLMERQGVHVGITDVVRFMGATGQPFSTCDASGMFWADVDTIEDYRSTDRLLRERHGERLRWVRIPSP